MQTQPVAPQPYRRHLAPRVARALGTSRVVNVIGPRQAGKTTLVRALAPPKFFLTLDDTDVEAALAADPYGFLRTLRDDPSRSGPIVLDEVQRLPQLALVIKRLVDEDTRPGQFLLTGSSNILSSGQARDSLAGRALTLQLHPLSAGELARQPDAVPLLDLLGAEGEIDSLLPHPSPCTRDEMIDRVVRGGFPVMRQQDSPDREDTLLSYIDAMVERDAVDLFGVRKPEALRLLVQQLAVRTAGELNLSDLGNTLRISRPTAEAYVSMLEQLFLVARLGAWTASPAKRDIKTPKLHLLDTGCAAALRQDTAETWSLANRPMDFGAMLESWVHAELVRTLPLHQSRWRLYHWREKTREVDLIAQAPDGRMVLMEIKAATTLPSTAFDHLDAFAERFATDARQPTRVVFYLGARVLPMGPRRLAVPLSCFWGEART